MLELWIDVDRSLVHEVFRGFLLGLAYLFRGHLPQIAIEGCLILGIFNVASDRLAVFLGFVYVLHFIGNAERYEPNVWIKYQFLASSTREFVFW